MTKTIAWGLAGIFVAAGSAAATTAGGKTVTYPSGTAMTSGYLAIPQGAGRKPALVVIQEYWGVNDFITSHQGFENPALCLQMPWTYTRCRLGLTAVTAAARAGTASGITRIVSMAERRT